MKKKILSLLMAATLVVGMTGCVQKPGSEGSDAKDGDKGGKGGYELALITDVGTIDDKSFNQGTWEGLEKYAKDKAWTRIIWDVTAVAWLLDGDFEEDYLVHSPIPGYDNHYVLDPQRHFIRYVYHVKRDSLFTDLFAKLGRS